MLARLAALVLLVSSCAEAEPAPPPAREWTLVYYLPYDNDLGRHADAVVDALASGLKDDRVAVLVLIDRPGPGGMERVILTRGQRRVHRISVEASGHPAVVGRLLDRAVTDLPAAHYALFVLDHGGKLDEVGLDGYPGGGPDWLSARGVAGELAKWRRQNGRPLDLLLLQQCGRGSIETYHLLREEAEVLVASQGVLAAPNEYYSGMLGAIARGDVTTGEDLARAIIDGEPPAMFVEYTALHASALEELPARLDDALRPLVGAEVRPDRRQAAARAITLRWADEHYADLMLLLRELYRAQPIDPAPLAALERFLTEEAIVHRRSSPASPRAAALSGLSVLVPAAPDVLDRNASLPLYRASLLDELLRRYPQDLGDTESVLLLPGLAISVPR